MKVTQLFQYPLKSCKASETTQLQIIHTGVQYDRAVAAMDASGNVLTARSHPQLLQVEARIKEGELTLDYPGMETVKTSIHSEEVVRPFRLFSLDLQGQVLGADVSLWISDVLRTEAQLIVLTDFHRPMLERHFGKAGDIVGLADASPIHLISAASLEDLNERLNRQFPIHQFRPNIVVEGCDPYAEDHWKEVRIGECLFEVHMACPRCVLSTIDPTTGIADQESEPLRSWASYRKSEKGKVNFGVYMIPRKYGKIKKGMEVEVV